jgi:hypothetical protein
MTEKEILLTVLLGGRPFEIEEGDEWVSVKHESGNREVRISLADLEHPEFAQRVIKPALSALDSAAYPERFERVSRASKQLTQ